MHLNLEYKGYKFNPQKSKFDPHIFVAGQLADLQLKFKIHSGLVAIKSYIKFNKRVQKVKFINQRRSQQKPA